MNAYSYDQNEHMQHNHHVSLVISILTAIYGEIGLGGKKLTPLNHSHPISRNKAIGTKHQTLTDLSLITPRQTIASALS